MKPEGERLALGEHFRLQAAGCRHLGSHFTADLLEHLGADCDAGGPTATALAPLADAPFQSYIALRVAGFLHGRALAGEESIAAHYASCGGNNDPAAAARTGVAILGRHLPLTDSGAAVDSLSAYIGRPPQTNEVGRASALIAGDLWLAERFGLPLRVLEIGSSAGLLLQLDRMYLEIDLHDSKSAALRDTAPGLGAAKSGEIGWRFAWQGPLPPPRAVEYASLEGCDVAPLDVFDPVQQRVLRSYVWPDQSARTARLGAAIELAIRHRDRRVESAAAQDWLPPRLRSAEPKLLTVVQHSIVWEYIPGQVQAGLQQEIVAAGERATAKRPLAWLRMEFTPNRPDNDVLRPSLRVTTWPGGEETRLAWCTPHGSEIEWIADWPAAGRNASLNG